MKGNMGCVVSRKAFSCLHCLMCSEGKGMHASEFVILFIVAVPCFIKATVKFKCLIHESVDSQTLQ